MNDPYVLFRIAKYDKSAHTHFTLMRVAPTYRRFMQNNCGARKELLDALLLEDYEERFKRCGQHVPELVEVFACWADGDKLNFLVTERLKCKMRSLSRVYALYIWKLNGERIKTPKESLKYHEFNLRRHRKSGAYNSRLNYLLHPNAFNDFGYLDNHVYCGLKKADHILVYKEELMNIGADHICTSASLRFPGAKHMSLPADDETVTVEALNTVVHLSDHRSFLRLAYNVY